MAFSFGAPAPQPAPQQQAGGSTTGGFSFGNAASTSTQPQQQAQQQPGSSSGGFSFGQPAQQQQGQSQQPQSQQQGSTFSFGQQPAQQSSGTGGGGLFGSSTNTQQQPSSTSTTSGFGGGGLFGSSTAQSKPAFSFGQSTNTQPQPQQQQQQPNQGQSQFGTSQFGASQQQPQQQFGQSQQQQQQQPQQDKKLGSSLSLRMEQVRQAWDTSNIQTCRFLTYFYNNIPPGVLPPGGPIGAGGGGPFEANPNFGRRQDAVGPLHDALWEKAARENPDRTKLVPVLAVGFSDVKSRVEAQEAEAKRQSEHLKSIMERISNLEQKHNLTDDVRAKAAVKRQTALHHRVLGIARKSHILVPALKGTSVTKEEEALRSRLEACEAELENAGGGAGRGIDSAYGRMDSASAGKLRAKVNELWVTLASVKSAREMLEREGRRPGVEWAVVDEHGVEEVTNILGQQQQGLNHLITTLEEDTKSLETVLAGLKGVQLVGVRGSTVRSAQ